MAGSSITTLTEPPLSQNQTVPLVRAMHIDEPRAVAPAELLARWPDLDLWRDCDTPCRIETLLCPHGVEPSLDEQLTPLLLPALPSSRLKARPLRESHPTTEQAQTGSSCVSLRRQHVQLVLPLLLYPPIIHRQIPPSKTDIEILLLQLAQSVHDGDELISSDVTLCHHQQLSLGRALSLLCKRDNLRLVRFNVHGLVQLP
mmetsp:Transcript_5205/g.18584  ORF Transcript_5205/g.18584 Transcript_5205/m.18584 type:complete len:201 (+) Transcript_5205:666-1268(+)